MDTQRLLSVLKVIHSELESLSTRVKDIEDVCKEIKEEMSIEFEPDDSDDSGEEGGDSDTESQASNQSAPASFQY